MILLFLSQGNNGYIWSANEWLELKEICRIVPKLIGSLPNFPRQEVLYGLPAALLPEEITLLKENSFAKIIYCSPAFYLSVEKIKYLFSQLETLFQKYQRDLHIKKKKEATERNYHSALQGKKRKIDYYDEIYLNENIKNEDLKITDKHMDNNNFSLIFTNDPWIEKSFYKETEWLYPHTKHEKLKYDVFKDLWKRKYYLSDGTKFGGDFLCYVGDPLKFHSSFIIICKEVDSVFTCKDLITYGRIATYAKKVIVIATRNLFDFKNSISYQSLKFLYTD